MTQNALPPRVNGHPKSGWVSFLFFQVVIVVFCVMLVVSAGKMLPGVFADTDAGRAYALRVGVYLSLPFGIAGAVAGIMALMQQTHRRLLGVIGTALNGGYVFLCLYILSAYSRAVTT